eukprot:TRINITY_DN249_c0_g1_i5.p1 TRINITY_DN249_c0_g1~~TRINITY_DN249_c0_g1_i5.p1  ORF type:complete len:547 (-),score=75.31 TRINITY_DN249_c0_g1_i5:396-1982(-)
MKAPDQEIMLQPHHISSLEESPTYHVLKESGLLTTKYRKRDFADLDVQVANSNKQEVCCKSYLLPCWYSCCYQTLDVPNRHLQMLRDNAGNNFFAGPGIHFFYAYPGTVEVCGKPHELRGHLVNGDRAIVVVDQGYVGVGWDNGQPVLLPPGIHEWQSNTLFFDRMVELNSNVIHLGPYTLVTVDEGYAGITQNNGRQLIIDGGKVYLLDHKNWKFEKFISLKIQTDNLQQIKATTADNVIMSITSTVNWRIVDVQTVARLAAETMSHAQQRQGQYFDITKLRKDVLKQAEASLASFIGQVNYSGNFQLAAAIQKKGTEALGLPIHQQASSSTDLDGKSIDKETLNNPMFNRDQIKSAVEHANEITMTYGVRIISINIISADPADPSLRRALASGAVSAAEALQAETTARGQSKAVYIKAEASAQAVKLEAQGQAEALMIKAQAEGEAAKVRALADGEAIKTRAEAEAVSEKVRAKASKEAAIMLEESDVAVNLATIGKTGEILGKKDKFFFSQDPSYLSNIILKGAM